MLCGCGGGVVLNKQARICKGLVLGAGAKQDKVEWKETITFMHYPPSA